MNLQESGEMYLESILVLSKEKDRVRSIDVVEYMGFSKPSVSRAIGLLRGGGYVNMDADGYLTLTEEGLEVASKIYERHSLLSSFLISLGVSEKTADEILRNQDFIADIGRPDTRLQEAKAVIEEMLAAGTAVPAEDCEAILAKNGIRRSTAQSAKRELGIESIRMQNQWYWKLPEAPEGM